MTENSAKSWVARRRAGGPRMAKHPGGSALVLLLLAVFPALAADYYTWDELPELPETHGVAGSFAGVSGGALLVAGGAYFRVPPWKGGTKLWTNTVYVLEKPGGSWRVAGALNHPLAYGASVTTPEGVLLLGGSDGGRHYADMVRLRWKDGRLEQENLPSLPGPRANLSAALIGSVVYVAGGQKAPDSDSAMKQFLALDLAQENPRWRKLEPWPGPARILPVLVAQGGAVYLISGAELLPSDGSGPSRRYLNDAYRYQPGKGWRRIQDAPRPVVAAPAIAAGQAHIMIFGGDDGANAARTAELKDRHPGFRHDILAYHTITDTWTVAGSAPFSLVTTTAVRWREQVVIPGGEDRPGHRSPKVWKGAPVDRRSHFAPLDYTAIGAYLLALVFMGVYLSRREQNTEDFFLAGRRIPWWAAGLSIFGTQLSAISIVAAPAKVFATDWTYFLANVAAVMIMPVVVYCYLPFYRRLNVTTAYEYLERRFNLGVRLFGSVAFMGYQLGRMAIVLFLPAIALTTVTGVNVFLCILVMGLLCTFYTVAGGIEAVIWTDVLQVIVLLGGVILSLILIFSGIGGFGNFVSIGMADNKFHTFTWSWDFTTTAVWVVLGGNLFANLGPYTSDQAVVQRYLTTKDEKAAARSIWTNTALMIPGTFLWFILGTALYVFYKLHPGRLDPGISPDAIFPLFIAQQVPAGASGLIIAALFAATMSTLDSSLNSVATSMVTDFYRRLRSGVTDASCLRLAKWLTALLGVSATSVALAMATFRIESLWDVFQQVMGLFGGALAGVFALGIFSRRATGAGALAGAALSVVVLYWVMSCTPVHFFLYALVGVLTCFLGGYAASLLLPGEPKNLEGLTIFTKGETIE